MKIISEKNEFMAGIYVIEFNTKNEAKKFIDIYSNCPIWPLVTKGRKENEVFLFAIELKRQKHGDFSEEHNTLAKNPNYIGAKEVTFKRDDTLIGIFKNYKLKPVIQIQFPVDLIAKNAILLKILAKVVLLIINIDINLFNFVDLYNKAFPQHS